MSHAAFVFDAYGTLFDVHAAVRKHADRVGPDGQLFSEIWRAKQLEYSWTRTLMGAYRDFWVLTEEALDYAFARVPSADRSLRAELLEAYFKLDCYPEVPSVLKALKETGSKVNYVVTGSGMSCCYPDGNLDKVPKGSVKFAMVGAQGSEYEKMPFDGMMSGFTSYRIGPESMAVHYHAHNGTELYVTPPIMPRTKKVQPPIAPPQL